MGALEFIMMLVLPLIVLGVIIGVVFIVMREKTKRAQISSIDKHSFEELASELRDENAQIKLELRIMKETIDSIHKMMKEVE